MSPSALVQFCVPSAEPKCFLKNVIFWECQPTFRRNISHPFLVSKNKPSKKPALLATCFHAGFLLGLLFDTETGGGMFLRNVGWHSTDYTALYRHRCDNLKSYKIFVAHVHKHMKLFAALCVISESYKMQTSVFREFYLFWIYSTLIVSFKYRIFNICIR
jgi:hypothetical protein